MLILIARRFPTDTAVLMGKTAVLNHCKAAFFPGQEGRILRSSRLTWSEEETFLAELAIR